MAAKPSSLISLSYFTLISLCKVFRFCVREPRTGEVLKMMKNRICGLLAVTMLMLTIVASNTIAHSQTFSVMYNFGSKSADPLEPTQSVVAQGRDGNLYSATGRGGIYGNPDGAVFKITPSGTPTVLYSFNLANSGPYGPFGGLTLGTDGNFYGTTVGGGASGAGTVFKITPSGTVTILHVFTVSDGEEPSAPPIQGTDGNFYGTAVAGGTAGAGTIYKITPSGTFTLLHSFDNTHGSYPDAPLVQGTDGNFYGTAAFGGSPSSYGLVYKITASGQFTVLTTLTKPMAKSLSVL
jgi:uncharacterized repeat protein (TIGR03803 family)